MYGDERSAGAEISAPAILPLWRAGAQRGSDECEAGDRGEQRAMCAVFHRNPAKRCRGAAPVRWRLVPEPRPAGVANSQTSRCFDTLALGSWFATRRATASPGALTISATRLHNGAPVQLTPWDADCPLPGVQRCGAAEVPLGLWLAGALKAQPRPAWDMPEAPWAIRRSGLTRRTPTLVGQAERPSGTT